METELRQLYLKRLRLVQKIKNILQDINSSSAYSFAIQLCRHHNLIEDACQAYELALASANVGPVEKSQLYEDYANYCSSWGRLEKALTLLQKKLSLETEEAGYYSTIALICSLTESTESLRLSVVEKFRNWQRQPEEDDTLLNILNNIK
jgi:tetratricopeptide (TPR) repeat protein